MSHSNRVVFRNCSPDACAFPAFLGLRLMNLGHDRYIYSGALAPEIVTWFRSKAEGCGVYELGDFCLYSINDKEWGLSRKVRVPRGYFADEDDEVYGLYRDDRGPQQAAQALYEAYGEDAELKAFGLSQKYCRLEEDGERHVFWGTVARIIEDRRFTKGEDRWAQDENLQWFLRTYCV